MDYLFRLFWLRENGCDAGTPLRAGELAVFLQNPTLRQRILSLSGEGLAGDGMTRGYNELRLRFPYLDRREWRDRWEILGGLEWKRQGDVIAGILPPGLALRDATAVQALTDPAWISAPGVSDPLHFPVWQNVSIRLQRMFRTWISEEYFRDIERFKDRQMAYPMIVYQAARSCHGTARGGLTYDFGDYPECRHTIALATKMTGRRMQAILAGMEQRLHAAGRPELAHRYAPVWQQDVMVAVRKKPKLFIALLRAESAFIEALAELSMNKSPAGVHHFAKVANQALRSVYGMDVRRLGVRAIEETTRILESRGEVELDEDQDFDLRQIA